MKSNKRRIALVTGAGSGIGAAIAQKIIETTDHLILLDLNLEPIDSLAQALQLKHNKMIQAYQCDVGNGFLVEHVLNQLKEAGNLPNILVNNAGYGGPFHTVDQVTDAEWDRVINTNLRSIFLFARHLLPEMKKQSYGRIVNIASIQGFLGAALSSTYVASKHGVIGYTKAIAAEWGEHGITCNAICPGYVNTRMGVQDNEINNHMEKVIHLTPARRIATPQEIAELANYLIGDEAAFINGSSITIDGGLSCHVGVS
ncbi:SDR family oxidoreductase [Legionella sp. PATHC035]|uniref:SDR family NAD(P)-dependent oxidoreductase n=1 Tax=Legionella sp. PATHC035 TaxID=2992040 RepID=UPI0022446F3F|nr:SDR family oxidoreductase [Legionella sp. PATHC035]MCW8407718.1 SDR family oxidoreductase [Legionella sp. PATHC035]